MAGLGDLYKAIEDGRAVPQDYTGALPKAYDRRRVPRFSMPTVSQSRLQFAAEVRAMRERVTVLPAEPAVCILCGSGYYTPEWEREHVKGCGCPCHA